MMVWPLYVFVAIFVAVQLAILIDGEIQRKKKLKNGGER